MSVARLLGSLVFLAIGVLGCQRVEPETAADNPAQSRTPSVFDGMQTGDEREVRRGGCYSDEGWSCRSAFRLRFEPERHHDHIGFRVVAVPK